MRYCIWNNKGGIGKTFLTYCVASEYAIKNPTKNIVVVDMCPQANISAMLLGGDGKGEENVNSLSQRSIASYIKSRYKGSKFDKTGTELDFFIKVKRYNEEMPDNLYLVSGDTDLDICSVIIDYLANAPEKNAWKNTMFILKQLLESFESSSANVNKENVFFMDCNPSFANYTQLSIVASDRILIPCTGDYASIQGVLNLLKLIYGVDSDEEIYNTFHSKVEQTGIKLPLMHSFIINKTRTSSKTATKSYKAYMTEIENMIMEQKNKHFTLFTDNIDITKKIKDANNISVVVNYNGLPISKLEHKKYEVYDQHSQINQEQITSFLNDISNLIKII